MCVGFYSFITIVISNKMVKYVSSELHEQCEYNTNMVNVICPVYEDEYMMTVLIFE